MTPFLLGLETALVWTLLLVLFGARPPTLVVVCMLASAALLGAVVSAYRRAGRL